MDDERTILVTTHQVEEIEYLLTDVIFIEQGKIALDTPVEQIGERYSQLIVKADQLTAARSLQPFGERSVLGRTVLFYDGVHRDALAPLGELGTPTIADLFVARMQKEAA
jgi:ABC-2 type transport system ATP-binding protein